MDVFRVLFTTLLTMQQTACGLTNEMVPPTQINLALGLNTTMWLSWTTPDLTSESIVMFGTSNHTMITTTGDQEAYADIVIHRTQLDLSTLPPDTKVLYQCGDRNHGLSPQLSFKTPPTSSVERELLIPMYGDMGITNSEGTLQSLLGLVEQSDFFYHAGDIGYADDYYRYPFRSQQHDFEYIWNSWADMMHPITSRVPYMTAPGNHEADCHDYGRLFCEKRYDNFTAYNKRYRMPGSESGGAQSMWFSFDYGNVHFVSINTETDYSGSPEQDGLVIKELYNCGHFGDQMKWLKADLAKADANRAVVPWIIVVGHRPFYSTLKPESDDILWGGVSASMSAAFEPLFKASSVDLYVGGHVHAYERHLPVSRGSVPTPAQPLNPYFHPAATVHVTPGSAGNVEGLDTKEHWYPINRTRFPWFGKRDFQSFGYGILRVRNATNLHWSFVNAKDDSILDEFELVKAEITN